MDCTGAQKILFGMEQSARNVSTNHGFDTILDQVEIL